MTEENKKAKSKLPLIIAAVVLVVVVLAGAGGWWYFQQQAKQVEAPVPEALPPAALVKKPVFLPLTKFVVSIPGDDRLHYLMLELSIMSYNQEQLDLVEEYRPVVRNGIITLLSELHYNDLTQPGVMEPLQVALRERVQKVMNDMASSNGIDQVLITKMVVQ
ncbi:Flagellar biosynthesis protein FliL [Photobacterium marinum]|uniref:Flagellar protein FliL n=1 Tax=Photobacterium marinum TaxID=1056511 RepID=L8JFQ4_9GAMM|nr:flagellar basal body-associated FliL family protein [Photobacterium marinum]ELR67088.1 Flagellar biosynthesis protein FliL [Photobacterium marinum]